MSETLSSCAVVGGGAAGVFAAIACAEAGADVVVVEKAAQPLTKVRISGGGRCNVTNACSDPRSLVAHYPRGGKALLGAFTRFGPKDTVEWFAARGVPLRSEPDGRMFPVSDSSQTIVDCLLDALVAAGARLRSGASVVGVTRRGDRGFTVGLPRGEALTCSRLLIATGGCRSGGGNALAAALGHAIVPPVPSLFSFHVTSKWVHELAGVSVADVAISVPGTPLCERGALLLTHSGLSGPAVLRLSAWGARLLHDRDYRFDVMVNWQPDHDEATLVAALAGHRRAHAARLVANAPIEPLPARLWELLTVEAGIVRSTRWGDLTRHAERRLIAQLAATRLPVAGKSVNKDEFVTSGGVRLEEVDFRTMGSRICPGLHFAGEVLDIDGVTGGFNFQAAWTTGWIAGRAMAGPLPAAGGFS